MTPACVWMEPMLAEDEAASIHQPFPTMLQHWHTAQLPCSSSCLLCGALSELPVMSVCLALGEGAAVAAAAAAAKMGRRPPLVEHPNGSYGAAKGWVSSSSDGDWESTATTGGDRVSPIMNAVD
mmetsp:Transcript_29732/g.74891  ORF Transcript_29732/g.74891 Transcript_29732/m.74891 type:complete len:124 (-) Transcript_29732:1090-1461(-)